MNRGTRRIPDAMLERYLAGALQEEAKARIEATLAGSPDDQVRLAELRADTAAFLVHHPPRTMVERFSKKGGRAIHWLEVALLIPALASAVIVLELHPAIDSYTPKGSVILVMYRKLHDGSFAPVSPDVPLAPEDSVGFLVKTLTSGFVAVLSKDAKGTISVYYPYEGSEAAPYDPHQQFLPYSITLDDTLGREDVYALYSPEPFDLEWAVEALKRDQLPEEAASRKVKVGQTSFTKQK